MGLAPALQTALVWGTASKVVAFAMPGLRARQIAPCCRPCRSSTTHPGQDIGMDRSQAGVEATSTRTVAPMIREGTPSSAP